MMGAAQSSGLMAGNVFSFTSKRVDIMLIEPKKRRGKNPVTVLSKGFEEDLLRQGYRPGTIWKQRKLLNDLIGWLQGQQIAMGDLSMAQVDRFMADRRAAGAQTQDTQGTWPHSRPFARAGAGASGRSPRGGQPFGTSIACARFWTAGSLLLVLTSGA